MHHIKSDIFATAPATSMAYRSELQRKYVHAVSHMPYNAMIEEDIYVGDEQLETLFTIKSKEELIGDIIMLLQSPAKNVISALSSSGGKLSGILQTLSNK